jgi:hypothetical protein
MSSSKQQLNAANGNMTSAIKGHITLLLERVCQPPPAFFIPPYFV